MGIATVRSFSFVATVLCWTLTNSVVAQSLPSLDNGIRLGEARTTRWNIGMTVRAGSSACYGIFGSVPVPAQWPEQTVKIVDEQSTHHVQRIKYRDIDDGVRQMLISIPRLEAGGEARVIVTFEVTRHATLEPINTGEFVEAKRVPRDVSIFTGPSPYIESRHSQIRSVAKQIVAGKADGWEKVEAIYDWVRENVTYREGDLKGALAALRDGNGDCEELTSLFVALCRANKIPARTVWIPGHCYPEFYLVDGAGNGHWFPCQAAGTRAFGNMPEFRPILQKGDNFRVPEKKEPQRYVAEFCKIKSVSGPQNPQVIFAREILDNW